MRPTHNRMKSSGHIKVQERDGKRSINTLMRSTSGIREITRTARSLAFILICTRCYYFRLLCYSFRYCGMTIFFLNFHFCLLALFFRTKIQRDRVFVFVLVDRASMYESNDDNKSWFNFCFILEMRAHTYDSPNRINPL